jgi:hypothetical protein
VYLDLYSKLQRQMPTLRIVGATYFDLASFAIWK